MPALLAFFFYAEVKGLMTENKDLFLWTCLLAMLLFCGCNTFETIAEGLSQQDANLLVVVLKEHAILAKKKSIESRKGTQYNILVNKAQVDDALSILVYEQLPKSTRPGFKEVYPPGSSGLIPTKSEEHARLIMAQEGELESMLKILPNVVDVRVALSIDLNADSFKASQKSAAVTLTYKPENNQGLPISAAEIASLVSSAAGSILMERVTVVMKPLTALSWSTKKAIDGPVDDTKYSRLFIFGLLGLTILALALAAYAFIRLPLKNQRQKISTEANG